MQIKLLHDTNVRFAAGTVLDVSEQEAQRLRAFNNAIPAEAEKPADKPKASKKPGKK